MWSSVGRWEGWLHVHSADTLAFLVGESDVALFTPLGSEGVSDNPVVLTIIVTITDDIDDVIELGSALWGVEDTTGIVEEDWLRSLDSNGDDVLGGSGLELLWLHLHHVSVGSDSGWVGSLISAHALLT